MRRLVLVLGLSTLTLGCAAARPAPETPAPATKSTPAPVSSTPAPPVASATAAAAPTPEPCGALGCLAFATPRAAFEHALTSQPRVIALGESHAQKGAPKVASTTRRFAEELLPALSGRVGDLVIELLTTDGRCGKQTEREVAERQKPVTKEQADSNQNEFVALGFAAKKLGIAPRALTPSCDELSAVTRAGSADIERMLALIADATVRETERLLATPGSDKAVLIYGGALHNDLVPRPGREAWSYAGRVRERAGGRYVEIDLVVPEFVKPASPWESLPWYAAFVAEKHRPGTLLFNPSPASYVLVFPRTTKTEPTP